MSSIHATRDYAGMRKGRPLVFTLAEAAVFVLIAIALIATAAVPAMVRHPHVAQAQTVASAPVRP
jgi:hypothetical protein